MKADYDTPAPSLFISQNWVNWFDLAREHHELNLSVDFEPAPRLETIERAYRLAPGNSEFLTVVMAGKKPGTFDVSVEAFYLVNASQPQIDRISAVFGHEPNGYMDFGWEWFSGWP
jgi:hypothetical protein